LDQTASSSSAWSSRQCFLLIVARPRLWGRSAADWGVVALFGLTLATLNNVFYHSISLIPLGAAMTLETPGRCCSPS